MFRFALDDVAITMKFSISHRYEPKLPETYTIPHLIVTDKRIVFLDESEPPRLFSKRVWFKRVPKLKPIYNEATQQVGFQEITPRYGTTVRFADSIDFGPFWVLKRSLNEELHQEFRSDPRAFSKAPFNVWWVQGLRDWTWVESLGQECSNLTFGLVRVQDMSERWETGAKHVPASNWEGSAQLSSGSPDDAKRLKDRIEDAAKPDLGTPFSPDYIAGLPTKPASGAVVAYFYVFWTAVPATIVLAILWGMEARLSIAVPVLLVFCAVVVYLLRIVRTGLERRASAGATSRGGSVGDANVKH